MKSALALATLLVAATPAFADTRTDTCRVERQAFAKSACLELVFHQGVHAMSQDIAGLLSRLQAATAPELIALQRQYDIAQQNWLQQLGDACAIRHAANSVGFQTCRIGALDARMQDVSTSLARAAEDFGAPVEYAVPIPDAVEILIPLPIEIPFGGQARLPLLIPIDPQ